MNVSEIMTSIVQTVARSEVNWGQSKSLLKARPCTELAAE